MYSECVYMVYMCAIFYLNIACMCTVHVHVCAFTVRVGTVCDLVCVRGREDGIKWATI